MQVKKILNNPLYSLLAGGIVLALIFYSGKIESKKYKNNILSNPATTIGIVTNIDYKRSVGHIIYYQFNYNNNLIDAYSSGLPEYGRLGSVVIGKKFPVIFNKSDSKYHKILILPKDFQDYSIPFPDSLSWVSEYLEKHQN